MTTLREKMMQDLKLAGYAQKTQRTYLDAIEDLAKFCWAPAELGQEQVRAWVERLIASKVGPQRLRQHFAALKFLYGKTLGRPELVSFLSWPKDPDRLPMVLSAEQVGRLLEALESPKYRVFFTTVYATGMRIGEVCHLDGVVGHCDQSAVRDGDAMSVTPEVAKNEVSFSERFLRIDKPVALGEARHEPVEALGG